MTKTDGKRSGSGHWLLWFGLVIVVVVVTNRRRERQRHARERQTSRQQARRPGYFKVAASGKLIGLALTERLRKDQGKSSALVPDSLSFSVVDYGMAQVSVHGRASIEEQGESTARHFAASLDERPGARWNYEVKHLVLSKEALRPLPHRFR